MSRSRTITCPLSSAASPPSTSSTWTTDPNNSYHHTDKDTMDKISAHSLTIDGDVFMETIRLVNAR